MLCVRLCAIVRSLFKCLHFDTYYMRIPKIDIDKPLNIFIEMSTIFRHTVTTTINTVILSKMVTGTCVVFFHQFFLFINCFFPRVNVPIQIKMRGKSHL